MNEGDLAPQDAYFDGATDRFLIRMGVDPSKIRGKKSNPNHYAEARKIPRRERPTFGFAFEQNGKLIGGSALKGIVYGDRADVHGHLWDESLRGKGLATGLALEYLRHVFNLFELKTLIAEPSVGNIAPNKLLQKLGLKIVDTYEIPASGILLPRTANRYEITREFLKIDR